MSKPNKKRASASGQYVSPLLNELEWLDEEPEVKPAAAAKNRPKRKSAKKPKSKSNKSGPTAKIYYDRRKSLQSQQARRSSTTTQPLLMLDKMKQPRTAKAWVKHLFEDLEARMPSDDDAIAEAIHSFRRGLDGILKNGEELKLFSPRRRPVVIDVAAEAARAREEEMPSSPHDSGEPEVHDSAAEADRAVAEKAAERQQPLSGADVERGAREIQHYGLIPYRFNVFQAWIELPVFFAVPFADGQYVLVATSNQPGCHVVISEKTPTHAVVRLIRDGASPRLDGELNWIALGADTSPVMNR